jgi:hypothetical protein
MTSRLTSCLLLLGVVVAIAPGTISAGSYKWVDEKGNVTYSDRPPQSAESPATAPAEVVPLNLKNLDVRPLPPPQEQDFKKYLPPAVIPRSGPTRIDDLLELSGVRAQLVGPARGIAKELRPAPGIMNAKDQASIDRVLSKSLRPEALYGLLREAFIPQVDRTNLEAAAAWLRSVWARWALRRLRIERRFEPPRVMCGDTAHLVLTAWNRKLIPLPWLRAEEPMPIELQPESTTDGHGWTLSARSLVKHAGLCPRDNSSGSYEGKTTISGRGRPGLRLAAWSGVFTALQHNPVLAARHRHLTTRAERPLTDTQARVAVAASLLRQLHAVVTTRTAWDPAIAAGLDRRADRRADGAATAA